MDDSALKALLERRAADRGATIRVEDRGEEGWHASFRVPLPALPELAPDGAIERGVEGAASRRQALDTLLWLDENSP